MQIDPLAQTFGLPICLLIPIAAKNKNAIEKYIGSIKTAIGNDEAFVVNFEPLELPNELPIWKHNRGHLLNSSTQIWVDVDFQNYRNVYLQYYSEISKYYVIDHVTNRRFAKKCGFRYIRLLHVDREVNSSSGRGAESLAMKNIDYVLENNSIINDNAIEYADPADLAKMLNIKVGGFGLDGVRICHDLFF